MPIVTLLSDFGAKDSYVAQMKGVILDNSPNCQIVDITHEVQRHNVLMGSLLLETAVPYFPKGTVHVAVVDPGVGSERLPIVIRCKHAIFVGPDNGLLIRAARKLGVVAAYRIQRPEFRRAFVSSTFHGRDIFAVAAGKLMAGLKPESVGPRVSRLVELNVPGAKLERGALKCRVIHVDVFGNVITSAANDSLVKLGARLGQRLMVRGGVGSFQGRCAKAYEEVNPGELAVLKGSQGYVEVAVREESAAALLEVGPLDELEIRLVK
ncbi:MAG: S-adenosyl-l-methionine hydroxide adenosyltransferase family protein [Thermoproteota archaeon]